MNTKHILNSYTPMDGDGLARSLEKQARNGWHLTKYGDFLLHFEKGAPQEIHYAITFFPEATQYDPAMPEEQETYVDMCAQQGWELVEAKGPMQLFRSTRTEPIPIETDEGYKLRSIQASLKKTFLPSRIILLLSMAMQLLAQWQNFQFNAFSMVSSNTSLSIVAALLTLFVYLAFDILWYFIWYTRSKHTVAEGGACVSPLTGLRKAMLWVPLAAAVVMMAVLIIDAPSPNARLFYISTLTATFGIIAFIAFLQKWFKKQGYPAKKTRNLTIAAAVVLALTLCGGMAWAVLGLDLAPLADRAGEILQLPEPALTLHDLTGIENDATNWATHEIDKSVLATYTTYIEHDSGASLEYQLVKIQWGFLRELSFDVMADRYNFTDGHNAGPDPRWDAEKAYMRSTQSASRRFLVLYEDLILYLSTDIPLDGELIARIEHALIE